MDVEQIKYELFGEIAKLMEKFELSKSLPDNCFEPGMMENLDQYYGEVDEAQNSILFRTNVKGLRYEGRTPRLETLNVGDTVKLVRESDNRFNQYNFMVDNIEGKSLGNMPAELCNVIAPLYDQGLLTVDRASVSYIERIQDRSRYAKQGVLFIEILMHLRGI